MTDCPDCGSTHLGVACGMTFGERLRTVLVDRAAFPGYEPKNYFDQQSVDDLVGPDARERMMEDTKGLGYAVPDTRGDVWHRNRKTHEAERLDPEAVDRIYLGGASEREYDPAEDSAST